MKKAVVHQDEQDALSFELLWSAVEGSFTLEELADLHYSVTSAKCPGQGKAHLLSVIKKVVSTQRDVFGVALKDNFYNLMTKALRRRSKDPSMIVRLKPHIYSLLRRIQRLYQVHSPILYNHQYAYLYSYPNNSIHMVVCMYSRYPTWGPMAAFRLSLSRLNSMPHYWWRSKRCAFRSTTSSPQRTPFCSGLFISSAAGKLHWNCDICQRTR